MTSTPTQIKDYLASVKGGIVCFAIRAQPGTLAGMTSETGKEVQEIDMNFNVSESRVSFYKSGKEACWLECPEVSVLRALSELGVVILAELSTNGEVLRATLMVLCKPDAEPRRVVGPIRSLYLPAARL